MSKNESACRECGGHGVVSEPYSPDSSMPKVFRFLDVICTKCEGTGYIFKGSRVI